MDNTKGGEFEVPIGAIVKYSDTGQLQLVDDEGNEHWVDAKNSKKVRAMHQSSVEGVEDMVSDWSSCVQCGGSRKRVTLLKPSWFYIPCADPAWRSPRSWNSA